MAEVNRSSILDLITWDNAAKGLKLYCACAALHSLWKVHEWRRKWKRFEQRTSHLPGEDPDYLGKTIRVNLLRLHDWHTECMLPHSGKPLVRRASPEKIIFCNTLESIRFILKDDFDEFTKPSPQEDPMFEMMSYFLGNGIFVVRHGVASREDHETWYKQRKTASKIFTKNLFNQLAHETFVAKSDNLMRHLASVAEQNVKITGNSRGDGARVVDLQEKLFAYTFDSIQKIFFDEDVDSITGDPDEYAVAFDAAHRSMFNFVFTNIPLHFFSRFFLPYPFGDLSDTKFNSGFLVPFLRQFNPDYKCFTKNVKYLHRETEKRVLKMRTDPNLPNRRDLMSNFLKSSSIQGGQPLSDKEIGDLMLNFILAGRDTTACTLSWLFYELCINPDVQEKLAKELFHVLGGKIPTLEDLEATKLPYLNGVLYETLRLHPPVPLDLKIASVDVTFPDGTMLPAGTKAAFAPYTLGRDPARYPNPEKFDPARWIPFTAPDPYDFPVFQAGPRLCLGQSFSIFESKVLIAQVLRNFTFTLLDGEHDKISYALMLTMSITNSADKCSHNLWLVPRPRSPISSPAP